MTTMRETVRDTITDHVSAAASRDHELFYERLEVRRDGELRWVTAPNENERTIDERDESQNAVPVPTLAVVGRGNVACNCEWCSPPEGEPETPSDEIDHETEVLDHIESEMVRHLDQVPVGYFDDEEEE